MKAGESAQTERVACAKDEVGMKVVCNALRSLLGCHVGEEWSGVVGK